MQTFLLLGQTGVGKSSFVNATFGVKLAETDEFEACTKIVQHYARDAHGEQICLIDTPGLSESPDPKVDQRYLKMVSRELRSHQNCVTLYFSPCDENRLRSSEMSALQAITKSLGPNIWTRSRLILTFASLIVPKKLDKAVRARSNQIADYIAKISPREGNFNLIGFEAIGVVDNVVPNWAADCIPIADFLVMVKKETG